MHPLVPILVGLFVITTASGTVGAATDQGVVLVVSFYAMGFGFCASVSPKLQPGLAMHPCGYCDVDGFSVACGLA